MNTLDTIRITHLRQSGWGYGKIADFTGLSKDQVRTYCARHQLAAASKMATHVCAWCGTRITSMAQRAKYCSPACRHRAWRENLTRVAQCLECGETFMPKEHHNQRFCSHACYVRHRFGTRGGRK